MNVTTQGHKAFNKPMRWTEEKREMVRREYALGDKAALASRLGISRKAVKHMAIKLGIKSLVDKNFYKLKPLHENSVLSYYWMGFIMADGHISKKGELSIGLSVKDKEHLEKLSRFLGVALHTYEAKMTYNDSIKCYSRLTCQDSVYGKKLLTKFGLNGDPKTYNPPKTIDFPAPKYFLAFLVGFIDGDGSMNKDRKWSNNISCIKLEMHLSWKDVLRQFCDRLASLNIGNTSIGVSKRGYVSLRLYKHKNFCYLKKFALYHGLPLLERKWGLIDETKTINRQGSDDLSLDENNFYP